MGGRRANGEGRPRAPLGDAGFEWDARRRDTCRILYSLVKLEQLDKASHKLDKKKVHKRGTECAFSYMN